MPTFAPRACFWAKSGEEVLACSPCPPKARNALESHPLLTSFLIARLALRFPKQGNLWCGYATTVRLDSRL